MIQFLTYKTKLMTCYATLTFSGQEKLNFLANSWKNQFSADTRNATPPIVARQPALPKPRTLFQKTRYFRHQIRSWCTPDLESALVAVTSHWNSSRKFSLVLRKGASRKQMENRRSFLMNKTTSWSVISSWWARGAGAWTRWPTVDESLLFTTSKAFPNIFSCFCRIRKNQVI